MLHLATTRAVPFLRPWYCRVLLGTCLLSLGYLGLQSHSQAAEHWSKAIQWDPALASVAMTLHDTNVDSKGKLPK